MPPPRRHPSCPRASEYPCGRTPTGLSLSWKREKQPQGEKHEPGTGPRGRPQGPSPVGARPSGDGNLRLDSRSMGSRRLPRFLPGRPSSAPPPPHLGARPGPGASEAPTTGDQAPPPGAGSPPRPSPPRACAFRTPGSPADPLQPPLPRVRPGCSARERRGPAAKRAARLTSPRSLASSSLEAPLEAGGRGWPKGAGLSPGIPLRW